MKERETVSISPLVRCHRIVLHLSATKAVFGSMHLRKYSQLVLQYLIYTNKNYLLLIAPYVRKNFDGLISTCSDAALFIVLIYYN